MDSVLALLQYFKPGLERVGSELMVRLYCQAELALNSSDKNTAIKVLRRVLALLPSESEEFAALRTIIFRLDGTHEMLLRTEGAPPLAELPHSVGHATPVSKVLPWMAKAEVVTSHENLSEKSSSTTETKEEYKQNISTGQNSNIGVTVHSITYTKPTSEPPPSQSLSLLSQLYLLPLLIPPTHLQTQLNDTGGTSEQPTYGETDLGSCAGSLYQTEYSGIEKYQQNIERKWDFLDIYTAYTLPENLSTAYTHSGDISYMPTTNQPYPQLQISPETLNPLPPSPSKPDSLVTQAEMQPAMVPFVRIYAEEVHRSDYADSGRVPAAWEAPHPPADFDFLLPPHYSENSTSVSGLLSTEEAIEVF